jgi:hypothetical protein
VNNGYTGSNETVALFELSGYIPSDITGFQTCLGPLGVQNNYRPISVDGTSNTPDSNTSEVEQDMDVVQGIAPGAQELVFEGPNNGSTGFDDVLRAIVNYSPTPQIASISWGGCEADAGGAELQNRDNIFAQGASEGIAFFAASGDTGADCGGAGLVGVQSPADDPYVVGVGGTELELNSDGSYQGEIGWNDGSGSSGGGISGIRESNGTTDCSNFYFPQAWYQSGTGVSYLGSSLNPCGARQIPDVSAVAASESYEVFCTASGSSYCVPTGWTAIGGTSGAAPFWAALTALVNQYLQSQGKQRVGWPNALFYQLFNVPQPYTAYHDIIAGENGAYSAETGYDMVTGIGSPDAWNLARDIIAYSQRVETDAFWGTVNSQGYSDMEDVTYQLLASPHGYVPVDVTQTLQNAHYTVPSLYSDMGKPGVVTYTQANGDIINSAFAYLQNGEIGEFVHDVGANTWSFVALPAGYGTTTYNPSVIALINGSNEFIGLFGITPADQLVEYFHSGSPSNGWSATNLSSVTGLTCDAAIAPAALFYPGGITEIFADCGNRLTQMYYANSRWNVNQALNGANPINIPNASEAFPGHSISASVAAITPTILEIYVASDRNGANALTEALYDANTGWSAYNLPSSNYRADQVVAQTLPLSSTSLASEVFVTSPSNGQCVSTGTEYIYQPAQPEWNQTSLALGNITGVQDMILPWGTAYSQADSGNYTGTGTPGASGGGACATENAVSVGESDLQSSAQQGWTWPTIVGNGYPGDNAGDPPAGVLFTY